MDTTISPADIAAIMNGNRDSYEGFGGCWWIVLLFIVLFGGAGFGNWGNQGSAQTNFLAASNTDNILRNMDLNAILNGQADISANVQRAINEVNGTVQRAAYDNLSETRDVQASLSRDTAAIQSTLMSGFANQKDCCYNRMVA